MFRTLNTRSEHTILISPQDYDRASKYSWGIVCQDENRPRRPIYAMATVRGRRVYLHRFLMRTRSGEEVNHIDGNGLNCQRSNMENCKPKHNRRAFQLKNPKSTSIYRGVSWCKQTNSWRANIGFKTCTKAKRSINLGRFESEIQAAKAYDSAAKKYFGKFANPNFKTKVTP